MTPPPTARRCGTCAASRCSSTELTRPACCRAVQVAGSCPPAVATPARILQHLEPPGRPPVLDPRTWPSTRQPGPRPETWPSARQAGPRPETWPSAREPGPRPENLALDPRTWPSTREPGPRPEVFRRAHWHLVGSTRTFPP